MNNYRIVEVAPGTFTIEREITFFGFHVGWKSRTYTMGEGSEVEPVYYSLEKARKIKQAILNLNLSAERERIRHKSRIPMYPRTVE